MNTSNNLLVINTTDKSHKNPTMETQTTSREKIAYLNNVNALKKKKKNKATGQGAKEKTTLQNGAGWKKKTKKRWIAGCTGHRVAEEGRRL